MTERLMYTDPRTKSQLREHYEIEKELASKLRNASKEERRKLYSLLYDELFLRVPNHSQLTIKASTQESKQFVATSMKFIKLFLGNDTTTFLEIGPGDCAISYEVANYVCNVYAVDVSEKITNSDATPANFHLTISDGTSVDLPENSVNVAYSNQLMEHLHPDDAFEQLENIYRVLTSGGAYICITPNRLRGPHDVSRYFDDEVAVGFHLKEYTYFELHGLFKKAGFSSTRAYIELRKKYMAVPVSFLILCELILDKLPYKLRKAITRVRPFNFLLGIRLVGIK